LSKRGGLKSWRCTNGMGRETVMILWTKETNEWVDREKAM
jgi:hypothetical protein